MSRTSLEATELIVRAMADTALDNEKYFAELDGVVGDGDFGISLACGFGKVTEVWASLDRTSPGGFLKSVAMTIASCVGGVSGAIWGTAFLRCAAVAGQKQELTPDDISAMLSAAAEGMKKRGQSDLGDKTLLDAFVPAAEELGRVLREGGSSLDAITRASIVAREKTEEIKPWIAKRGRASYSGERSRDSYDAGSIAVAMMAERIAQVWAPASINTEKGSVR